jgi:fibronectin-binding autotransporter adhesin
VVVRNWVATGSGVWGTGTNWDTGIPPDNGGSNALQIIFGNAITANSVVTLDANHTVGSLEFNNANSYTLAPSGGSILTLDNGSNTPDNITVLAGSDAISAPIQLSGNGGEGLNIVTANGTSLAISGNIGLAGTATGTPGLDLLGNGTVTFSGTSSYTGATDVMSGTLQLVGGNISQPASSFIVGDVSGSNATVNISGGGLLSSASATIGNITGSNGTMTISDPGSTWSTGSGSFFIGASGNGSLMIANGATVSGTNAFAGTTGTLGPTIGLNTGVTGNVLVTGANTTWNTGPNYVGLGYAGAGNLTISNGATVTSAGAVFGVEAGGSGNALVTGANSSWTNSNSLYVGYTDPTGPASLTIANGAAVTASSTTVVSYIGTNPGSVGSVSLTGANSSFTVESQLFVGDLGTGSISVGSGSQVTVGNGITSGVLVVGYQSGGVGTVTLSAGSTLTVGNGTNSALLIVGDAPGSTGTVTLNGGTLVITPGSFIDLTGASGAVGSINLNAGTLEIGGGFAIESFGGTSNFTLGGGTLQAIGSLMTIGADTNPFLATGTTSTIDTNNIGVSLAGVISGSGSLIKTGLGTLTLSGVNTYTGATTVNLGTLLLNLASDTSGIINSTNNVTLGDGVLNVQGNSSGLSSQTLGNLTLSANAGSGIVVNSNGGTGSTLTLGNAWTRNPGSTLNVNTSSANSNVTSSPTLTGGILGYATVTNATTTGFLTVSGGNLVPYTSATALAVNSNSAGTNFITSGNLIMNAGNWSVNSLTLNATLGVGSLSLGGASSTLALASEGVLMTGASGYTISNGELGASGSEVIIHQTGTGTLTVSAIISGGAGILTKDGSGNLDLTASNTYTGGTSIDGGAITLDTASAAGTGSVTVNNGFLALGANSTYGFGGLTFSNGTLQYGTNVTTDISSGRTVTLGVGGATVDTGANNVTFASSIGNNGAGGLTKMGSGTLTLDAAETYTGVTTVNFGTLLLNLGGATSGVINSASALTLGDGVLDVLGNSSGLSSQILGSLTLSANAGSTIVVNSNGGTGTTLTLGNIWSRNAGSTLNINATTANANLISSPALTNSILGYATVANSTTTGFLAVSGGNLVPYTGASTLLTNSGRSTTNFVTAGSLTMNAASRSVNSLELNATGGVGSLNLDGSTRTLTITTGGLLMIGSNGFTLSNGTVGASGSELIVHQMGTGTLTISANVSGGAGKLTKDGSGNLDLTATNAYSGGTVINAGTITLGAANAAGTGVVQVNNSVLSLAVSGTYGFGALMLNNGTLQFGSGVTTDISTHAMTFSIGGATIDTGANNVSFANAIGNNGTGGLTKIGAGNLTLSGADTYAGTTVLDNGFLILGNTAALQDSTLNYNGQGGTLSFGTLGSATFGGLQGAQNLALTNNASAAVALTVGSDNSSTTFSGNLSGLGSLTVNGGGTLTLSGNESYAGATTLAAGTLIFTGNTANLGGGIVDNTALFFDQASSSSFGQGISGTGALTQIGAATLTLAGASTYAGNTTIDAGTLTFSGAGASLNNSANIYVGYANTGNLVVALGGNVTSGNGFIGYNTGSNGIVTVVNNSSILNLSGNLIAGDNGTANLTIANGGTVSLLGDLIIAANAGSNGTVNLGDNGTLMVQGINGIQAGSGIAALELSGVVQVFTADDFTTSLNATLFDTTTINTSGGNATWNGALGGAGNLTKAGADTLTLTAADTYTGNTTITGGTLTLDNSLALQNSTLFYNNQGGVLSFGNLTSATFGGLAGGQSLSLANGNATPAAVALNVGIDDISIAYGGALSGAGSLTKVGTAALVLTGNNTYTGGTTINTGTLQLGNGTTNGVVVGNGTVGIVDNSSLAFAVNTTAQTYAGVISGLGNLTLDSGALTLTTNNTYTGGTTISGGALQLGDGTTNGVVIGNSTVGIVDNASLAFAVNTTAQTYAGVISGAGNLSLDSGALTLTGNNTYTGGTTISGGTLQLGDGTTNGIVVGNGTVGIVDNSSLAFAVNTTAQTYAGVISGSGNLSLDSGALTLTGNNTYTGSTSISAGTLEVNGSTAAVSEVDVSSGATLSGNGSIGGNVVLNTGAILNPGNGLGTLTVANLTWNGSTDGSATMKFALSNSSNASALLVVTGTLAQGGGTDFIFDFEGTGYFDGVDVENPNIYTLMDFGTNSGFTVSDFGYTNLAGGIRGSFILGATDLQFAVIPEPAAWGVLLGGMALLAAWRRKRS